MSLWPRALPYIFRQMLLGGRVGCVSGLRSPLSPSQAGSTPPEPGGEPRRPVGLDVGPAQDVLERCGGDAL
jgi:hypothetical protein